MTGGAVTARGVEGLRVLIVHEWIVTWAGSERVLAELLNVFPQADLVVGVMSRKMRGFNAVTARARETWLARVPGARRHHRWFLPLYPLAFASVDTRGYDLVISSSHAFAKCVRTSAPAKHLCYCYSPPRYLWDLQEAYQRDASASGLALRLLSPLLRRVDRRGARGVDHFVGISRYIAERISRSYGREASVVYPPVSSKPSRATSVQAAPRDGLLSLGRLVPYKRVDLAIEAANRLGARLIVAGDGPERARLEALAGPTVSFMGHVSEETAGALLETSALMLFCAEEDFGITPLEANAHGLPVVAYGRGGALETIVENESGVFFDELTPESLVEAVSRAGALAWDASQLRANARRFGGERFRAGVVEEARRLLDGGSSLHVRELSESSASAS